MGAFGNRPVVEAKVDGKGPFPFVLDTGASGTVLAATFAGAQKIPVVGRARVASPGAPTAVEADVLRIEKLELGGASITGLTAVALDLSGPFPARTIRSA